MVAADASKKDIMGQLADFDICMALKSGHLQNCGHVQVCLRDTIGSVVEMVAADANKKGLNIAYTMDEMLLRRAVLGDAIRIRQVGAESQALSALSQLAKHGCSMQQ